MMGQTSGIEKAVKCAGEIAAAYTIAKFGPDDHTLDVAGGSTDGLVGVFQHATSGAGEEVRVMLTGISRIVLGGQVSRGDWLTSDPEGKGVKAEPSAGTNASVVGISLASGASGDIIPVLFKQGVIQG